MKNSIVVSAPGKLMLFGEHSVIYGNPCIVTAVDQRMSVGITITIGTKIELTAPEVDLKKYKAEVVTSIDSLPKGARFVFTAARNFFKRYDLSTGLKIETKSDFSANFGFGSSSAVTVCVVKGLSELFGIHVGDKELFDICYKTVLDVQGVGSGFDIAAAIWGGTLYFVGGGKEIIQISKQNLPLIVGYTGIKADTATLVKKVAELKKEKPKEIGSIFRSINKITEEAKVALAKKDFKKLGKLANSNQKLLESLGVSTGELTILIDAARNVAAYGAKLSGAGGGDCMIAFSGNKARIAVENEISKKGGIVIHVKTGAKGVRVET